MDASGNNGRIGRKIRAKIELVSWRSILQLKQRKRPVSLADHFFRPIEPKNKVKPENKTTFCLQNVRYLRILRSGSASVSIQRKRTH